MLFGQQASDSDGAVLWAAVAERLRLPVVSQAAELEVADGKVAAKRQTEFGYDVIEAPLPAVVAVSDAINEPRYPSLKGIMGAKSKPQETLSLADLGVEAGAVGEPGSRTEVLALHDRRRAATRSRSRTTARRRRRSSTSSRRSGCCEHARLPRAPRRRARRRARSACSRRRRARRRRVAGVVAGSGVRDARGAGGRVRRATVYVADDPALEAPLPQPRVDVLAALVRDEGFDTVLFAQLGARRRRRGRPRRAARRGPELGPRRPRARGRQARRQAARARATRSRRRGLDVGAALALFRSGTFEPAQTGGSARGRGRRRSSSRTTRRRRRCSSRRTRRARGRRSRTPTSSSPAAAGSACPRASRSSRSSRRRSAARSARRAPSSTRAGTRTRRRSARPGKTVSPKLYVACGISGAIQHKVGMQGSGDDRRDQQGPERADLRVRDFGVVGDLHEIVPKLTELVRARKAS